MIIAIDGPAGSGKSTTAREVARHLDFLYLDTGAMYRAVAFAVYKSDILPDEETVSRLLNDIRIDLKNDEGDLRVLVNGEDVSTEIRSSDVGIGASKVAKFAAVRAKLVDEQRRIARQYEQEGGGVVVDGRDIGTVVFPGAQTKFFMVADEKVRARRRFDEIIRTNQSAYFQQILEDIRRRDKQDYERTLAPLLKADDAIEIDTSNLTIAAQVDLVLQHIRERN